ncbi:MAG: hypothetical protein ACI89J_003115 [Hyphomicrobiaceae bacterium]|jgi:hypothetical protein
MRPIRSIAFNLLIVSATMILTTRILMAFQDYRGKSTEFFGYEWTDNYFPLNSIPAMAIIVVVAVVASYKFNGVTKNRTDDVIDS